VLVKKSYKPFFAAFSCVDLSAQLAVHRLISSSMTVLIVFNSS